MPDLSKILIINKMRKTVLVWFTILVACIRLGAFSIDRMEPPFWYTGMKNTELQVMFHGEDLASSKFSMKSYPGVSVKEICRLDNPNYLVVYLNISESAEPGELSFEFRKDRKVLSRKLELRSRNAKPGAMGFSSADVLYLIMPDRFSNGNPDNDVLDGYAVDRNGGGRHGGDIQGIIDHLDYIDSLGVTAVWLNPVQFNKRGQSHGYAISDYYMVDPRLGSNEEYCSMIDIAHSKGIKVVMDMIFNHSGINHWWIEDIPSSDWFNQNWYAEQASERMRNPRNNLQSGWGRRNQINLPSSIEEFESLPQEEKDKIIAHSVKAPGTLVNTTHYKWVLMDPHAPDSEKDILVDGWFTAGMPDLNQRNRHLGKYLIQNSIWWIEYSRIDGIRMDTYPYADYDFMTEWCREIETEYPDFNIVGEGWYPRNSAAGWWQRNSSVNDSDSHLKTVMDFDLTFTAKREFLKESNTSEGSEAGLFKIYECLTQDFLIPDPDNVLVFLDNHDIARFMDEGDPIWKFKQGAAFLLTTRGIPQIYYGTEIAMAGPKSLRADFPGGWKEDKVNAFTPAGRSEYQNECWSYMSKLLNWRRSSNAVKAGKLIHYTPDNISKCYVYARTDGKDTVLVILNGSDTIRVLDETRFSEVIGNNTKGRDVVTEVDIDLTKPIIIPARAAYVLELGK